MDDMIFGGADLTTDLQVVTVCGLNRPDIVNVVGIQIDSKIN
jgi:hypothetical protein